MVTFFPLSHPSLSNALQHFLEYKHVQILTGVNMKIVLCLEAQVFLVEQVLRDADQYTDKVQQNFAGNYPDTAFTHHSAVWWLNAKFHETGSVVHVPMSGRPAVVTEKNIMDILDHIMQSP